jgi:hypothetical protein
VQGAEVLEEEQHFALDFADVRGQQTAMARVAWAVLAKSEAYRPPLPVSSTEAVVCN